MNIAFFSDSYLPQINGVVQSIKLYREELEKLGHTVYVFAPKYPKFKETDPQIYRYQSMPFAFYKEYRVTSPLSIKNDRALRKLELDLVHSHSPFSMGLLAETYANRKKIPHVYTHHTLWSEYIGYIPGLKIPGVEPRAAASADKLAAIFCNRTDQVIAPSAKIEALLRRYGTTKPIEILPTGIRLEDFAGGDSAALRQRFGIKSDEKVLLYMGRLGKEKDIGFVLDCFAKLHQTMPATRLMIAGDGPVLGDLKKQTAELQLGNAVVFTGYLKGDDRTAAYKAADVFCFTSKSETQGLVLVEAAACGLPLVVGNDLAFADIAIDGRNATVTPHREASYIKALIDMLGDTDKRRRYGAASRELAAELTAEHQAQKMVALYVSTIRRYQTKE